MKDSRSRFYEIILYKDFPEYINFLDFLNQNYEIIYILHDKDTYEEDSEDHVKGELKKEHYHILFRFENARYKSALMKELGYDYDVLVTPINNYKKYLLYMIHFNDKYKYNYNTEELKGSGRLIEITKELVNKVMGESLQISLILDYINEREYFVPMEEIINYSLINNYWSTFRRNYNIIRNYLISHNHRIDSKNNMKGGNFIET